MPATPASSRRVLRFDRSGSVAFEYGMLLAILALGVLAAMGGVAGETMAIWGQVSTRAGGALASPAR